MTTPLSQQRLLLEIKSNLPILTDEILDELRESIQIEHHKRNAEPEDDWIGRYARNREDREGKKMTHSSLTLADLPDEKVRDADGCWIWLRDIKL